MRGNQFVANALLFAVYDPNQDLNASAAIHNLNRPNSFNISPFLSSFPFGYAVMQYAASPILHTLRNASKNSNRRGNSTTSRQQSSIPIVQTNNPSTSSDMQSPIAPPTEILPEPRKGFLQNVLTHANRIRIVSWMVETSQQDGEKHIPSRAVRHFP